MNTWFCLQNRVWHRAPHRLVLPDSFSDLDAARRSIHGRGCAHATSLHRLTTARHRPPSSLYNWSCWCHQPPDNLSHLTRCCCSVTRQLPWWRITPPTPQPPSHSVIAITPLGQPSSRTGRAAPREGGPQFGGPDSLKDATTVYSTLFVDLGSWAVVLNLISPALNTFLWGSPVF
jgi:hypothetical protein